MLREDKSPARPGGNRPNGERRKKKDMPGGLWMRCPACEGMIFKRDMEQGLRCCPECHYHFQLNSVQRIEVTLDEGTFEEFDKDLSPSDPLEFTDLKAYSDRLKAAQEKTGLLDAAVIGLGKLRGREIVIGILDFSFIGGSMGGVVGEKLARAMDLAHQRKLPLIIFTGSGGARMMEGIISLMQMAKTCAALGRFQEAGGLFFSVLTDPSTGGVLASFASLGDIILAEPRAVIGFAGPRVIQNTIKQELPAGFQRSEFMLKHGFVDRIVSRKHLKDELARMMDLLLGPLPQPVEGGGRVASADSEASAKGKKEGSRRSSGAGAKTDSKGDGSAGGEGAESGNPSSGGRSKGRAKSRSVVAEDSVSTSTSTGAAKTENPVIEGAREPGAKAKVKAAAKDTGKPDRSKPAQVHSKK